MTTYTEMETQRSRTAQLRRRRLIESMQENVMDERVIEKLNEYHDILKGQALAGQEEFITFEMPEWMLEPSVRSEESQS
jgi:hypothetical protein